MSARVTSIPIPAAVPRSLRGRARSSLQAGHFDDVLYLVSSEDRLSCLRAMWRFIPKVVRPTLLASAISTGDAPSLERPFLVSALRQLLGTPIVDGDAARDVLAALPELVTLYRGTVAREAESGAWGICWTLDPERANWFATKHGRFRARNSAPVIVTATDVRRCALSGLLLERSEREVLVLPKVLQLSRVSWHSAVAEEVA